MKLPLDESAPRRLATLFHGSFEVSTVQQMGWAGSGNGELLRLAADCGFDALVTVDQDFEHEQNLNNIPVPVVIMAAGRNRLQELQPLVDAVVEVPPRGGVQGRVYSDPRTQEAEPGGRGS